MKTVKINNSIKNNMLTKDIVSSSILRPEADQSSEIYQPYNLVVKVGVEMQELQEAKQLWMDLSHSKFRTEEKRSGLQLKEREALIYDGYDSYARHIVVQDTQQSKVVAYVRIIDSLTAYSIGGYFCEAQFNLEKLRQQMQSAMELSRLVIAPEYNNSMTLSILWSGLMQYADENSIDIIFGTLPMAIQNSHYSAIVEIKQLKSKYMASNKYRVKPYQMLPPVPAISGYDFTLPEEVSFFFRQGAKLCGEAGWNKAFNQAELLFFINSELRHQLPQCIQQNEINMAGLVA